MAQLILHIGSHKTGTSSIQSVLTRSRERLRQAGVAYLSSNKAGQQVRNANGLAGTLGAGAEFKTFLRDDVADALFKPRAETCVVSSENLFWLNEAADVGRLADLLRPRFKSIRIVAYLRRQDQLALSHRKQVISIKPRPAARFYGFQATALPAWQDHLSLYMDYASKLDLWAEAFGAESVAPAIFDRDRLREGDAVTDFLHRAGLPRDGMAEAQRRNSAVGRERTMLALAAKAAGISGDSLRAIRHRSDNSGKFLPARADAEAFLAHCAEFNARLAESWTIDGAPFRFSDDFSMYPEVGDDVWTDKTARAAIAHAMLGAAKIQARKDRLKARKALDGRVRAGAEAPVARPGGNPGKGRGGGGGLGVAGKPGFRKRQDAARKARAGREMGEGRQVEDRIKTEGPVAPGALGPKGGGQGKGGRGPGVRGQGGQGQGGRGRGGQGQGARGRAGLERGGPAQGAGRKGQGGGRGQGGQGPGGRGQGGMGMKGKGAGAPGGGVGVGVGGPGKGRRGKAQGAGPVGAAGTGVAGKPPKGRPAGKTRKRGFFKKVLKRLKG